MLPPVSSAQSSSPSPPRNVSDDYGNIRKSSGVAKDSSPNVAAIDDQVALTKIKVTSCNLNLVVKINLILKSIPSLTISLTLTEH